LKNHWCKALFPVVRKMMFVFNSNEISLEAVHELMKDSAPLDDSGYFDFFLKLLELNIQHYYKLNLVKIIENGRLEQRELHRFDYPIQYKYLAGMHYLVDRQYRRAEDYFSRSHAVSNQLGFYFWECRALLGLCILDVR